MSTRSIIVVTGRGKHRDHSTARIYKHSDGYPTGVLPIIYDGISKAATLIEEDEKESKADLSHRFTADLVAESIECASLDVYGLSAKIEEEFASPYAFKHLGNQGDLEWIYILNLNELTLGIYGGGFSGDIPQKTVAKGIVDPASYADRLKPEYQDRERKKIIESVRKLQGLGLIVNNVADKYEPKEAKKRAETKSHRLVPDYNTRLDEEFGDLVIKLVKHDTSATGMPAYIEANIGKNPKDKGETVLDLGNYIYRRSGLSYQLPPEYRGKGKTTTLRWFMSWEDLRPVLPNIWKAAGKEYKPSMGDRVPFEFDSLIIQDTSRGVVLMKHGNPAAWIIVDWAGNLKFKGKKFKSFDDAEEFLSEKLGDEYETDREEFEIVPNGSRDSRYLDPKDPRVGSRKANPLNKLDQMADYLSNSLEHEEDDDVAAKFMSENFGVSKAKAKKVIEQWYEKKLNTKFLTDDKIKVFIEGVIE